MLGAPGFRKKARIFFARCLSSSYPLPANRALHLSFEPAKKLARTARDWQNGWKLAVEPTACLSANELRTATSGNSDR